MDGSDPVASVTGAENTEASTATTTATGTPTGTTGDFNASTPISSMADLKEKAPELYKAMMEGLAMNIVNEMRQHQEKLKEMQRQAQREAEGKS